MLLIVAWRNIWRNRARSLVIFSAIVIGLIAGILVSAVFSGLVKTSFEDNIQNRISHIQVHHPDFLKNREIQYRIPEADEVIRQLENHPQVQSLAPRTALDGMIASSRMSAGVRLNGIDLEKEANTTNFDKLLIEGTYFEEESRLPQVIIGQKLAEKLKVNVRSRLVLTFQDVEGELISASFTVVGLFSATQTAYEERTVFIKKDVLNELLRDEKAMSEVAILIHDFEDYKEVRNELASLYPELKFRHWEEIAPDMYLQQEVTNQSLIWIVFIILLGVAFGLLNTVLMSVFERIRELGMLMSIGMKKSKVFALIMLETLFLSITGGATGLVLSFILIKWLNGVGIDMAVFGQNTESLGDFGYSSMSYPYLETAYYFQVAFLVLLFAVLAAIYPAWKATRLVPAQAVRQE